VRNYEWKKRSASFPHVQRRDRFGGLIHEYEIAA